MTQGKVSLKAKLQKEKTILPEQEKVINVPISVKPSNLYKAWIECMNPVLGLKKREKELLEKMLLVYQANIHKRTEDVIDRFLLARITKKAIRASMIPEMSEASMNNHLVQLRKKGIITQEGGLSKIIKENLPIPTETRKTVISYKILVAWPKN